MTRVICNHQSRLEQINFTILYTCEIKYTLAIFAIKFEIKMAFRIRNCSFRILKLRFTIKQMIK